MKFIITTPPYTNESAGIVALHHLAAALEQHGHEVKKILFTMGPGGNPNFEPFEHLTEYIKDAYVVYPEIIVDNVLNSGRVIRYMLNKEGAITGRSINWGKNDFVLAYSHQFRKNADAYLMLLPSAPAAVNSATPAARTKDCTYVGKGDFYYNKCTKIGNSILVSRHSPVPKQQFVELLQASRFMFTWDIITGATVDAIFAGAIPVFLMEHPLSFADIDGTELGKIPRAIPIFGDTFEVMVPVDYEQQRLEFMERYTTVANGYSTKLGQVVDQIKNHFS